MRLSHVLPRLLVVVAIVVAAVPAAAGAATPGGDWPSYGHDLANSRFQPKERKIGPHNAASLQPAWRFSSQDAGGSGSFQSTAVVADGILYAGTSTNWVFAIDADSGKLRWKTELPHPGNGGVFALTIRNGRAYATVAGSTGPYAAALDALTGETIWRTEPLVRNDEGPWGTTSFASPVVWRDILFVATTGPDTDKRTHNAMMLLSVATGEVLARVKPIPDADFADGYSGGGIWATAAVDAAGYAYAGTSNPDSYKEHERTNAIVKIDLDRRRATFGQVVGSYKGTPDSYTALLGHQHSPLCQKGGPLQQNDAEAIPPWQGGGYNIPCAQFDLDFGASPNLIRGPGGKRVVGELQKSGVYHAAFTSTMAPAWQMVVGTPPGGPGTGSFGNASSTAYDGRSVYVAATPGQIFALDPKTGMPRWVAPVNDLIHYQALAVANGVVYTTDTAGLLDMFDARTGRVLMRRPIAADIGEAPIVMAGGVTVANNTVYAVADLGQSGGGWIVAYRPKPGVQEPAPLRPPPAAQPPNGINGAGSVIVAGFGSYKRGYTTPVAVTQKGGSVLLSNSDLAASHDVVSDELGPDGQPLFRTPRVPFGGTAWVEGLDRLEPGRMYSFHDSVFGKAKMHGQLYVLPGGG